MFRTFFVLFIVVVVVILANLNIYNLHEIFVNWNVIWVFFCILLRQLLHNSITIDHRVYLNLIKQNVSVRWHKNRYLGFFKCCVDLSKKLFNFKYLQTLWAIPMCKIKICHNICTALTFTTDEIHVETLMIAIFELSMKSF